MVEKKKKKKRSPIGCLIGIIIFIVLGIIGGFVLFKFEESTKSRVVELIYDDVVQNTKDAIKKCQSGESTYLDGQTCPATPEKTIAGLLEVYKETPNPYTFNENNLPDRGPSILRDYGSNIDVGFIDLSTSNQNIIFNVCFKEPCNIEENRQSSTVSIK